MQLDVVVFGLAFGAGLLALAARPAVSLDVLVLRAVDSLLLLHAILLSPFERAGAH